MRNNPRDLWDTKYGLAYGFVAVLGRQMKGIDESLKVWAI